MVAVQGAEGYDEKLETWRRGKERILERVGRSSGVVVVAAAPPPGPSIQVCATRSGTPVDCVYEVNPVYVDVAKEESSLAGGEVRWLNTAAWFCAHDLRCPAFVGDTILKTDEIHTTRQWATAVAPVLDEALGRWLPGRRG